ncbi:MAG TPA: glycosyltransferase family 2 protein [Chthoniobacterales bacterium]|nr:glycosyltransferase family 2 protein [Chthoniobacterales bacterium]
MKLIIQIPCYNEEETLGVAVRALPRSVPGIDQVEWMVVDDGSADRTAEVARELGVDHVIVRPHLGLARTFMAGIEAALARGADIIVNTDADNQYEADDIPKLVEPILKGEADMVIGARPILEIEHFSPVKKVLQRIGSWVVRVASKTEIADAPSGFRAISREAALQMNVFNEYTYTLETIIQGGQRNLRMASVPIRTNEFLRPSRLFKSIPAYIQRSILTIFRIFIVYKPLRFFTWLGALPFIIGSAIMARWVVLYFVEGGDRSHVPSLIAAAVLVLIGVQIWALGFVADLIAVNRRLLEDIQLRVRRFEFDRK